MRYTRTAFPVLAIVALMTAGAAPTVNVRLQPPARDFGYYPGDVLQATAIVTTPAGSALDTQSLPPVGPLEAAIDIRDVQLRHTHAQTGETWRIVVTYQTFDAPQNVRAQNFPGYSLQFASGAARFGASVPGFSVTVSPFRHDLTPPLDAKLLRPAPGLPHEDAGPPRRMALAGGLLALAGMLLLAASYWHAPSARSAFRDAARRLRREGGSAEEALQLLHRAFDATAGRRLLADDVPHFLAQHPRYAPLRPEIEAFFTASRRRFFGADAAAETADVPALARKLARKERFG